jgi:hypothetical protein
VTKSEGNKIEISKSLEFVDITRVRCNDSLIGMNHKLQDDYTPLMRLHANVDTLGQSINKEIGPVLRAL